MYELLREWKQIPVSTPLQLLPSCGALKFVAMDILEHFLRTTQRNQCVEMMADRYSKQMQVVPTSKTSAMQLENIFMDH